MIYLYVGLQTKGIVQKLEGQTRMKWEFTSEEVGAVEEE